MENLKSDFEHSAVKYFEFLSEKNPNSAQWFTIFVELSDGRRVRCDLREQKSNLIPFPKDST